MYYPEVLRVVSTPPSISRPRSAEPRAADLAAPSRASEPHLLFASWLEVLPHVRPLVLTPTARRAYRGDWSSLAMVNGALRRTSSTMPFTLPCGICAVGNPRCSGLTYTGGIWGHLIPATSFSPNRPFVSAPAASRAKAGTTCRRLPDPPLTSAR